MSQLPPVLDPASGKKLSITQLAQRINVPRKWVYDALYNYNHGMGYREYSRVGQVYRALSDAGLTWSDVDAKMAKMGRTILHDDRVDLLRRRHRKLFLDEMRHVLRAIKVRPARIREALQLMQSFNRKPEDA